MQQFCYLGFLLCVLPAQRHQVYGDPLGVGSAEAGPFEEEEEDAGLRV